MNRASSKCTYFLPLVHYKSRKLSINNHQFFLNTLYERIVYGEFSCGIRVRCEMVKGNVKDKYRPKGGEQALKCDDCDEYQVCNFLPKIAEGTTKGENWLLKSCTFKTPHFDN